VVVTKLLQRLKRGEEVEKPAAEGLLEGADESRRRTLDSASFGIKVEGADNVAVRLAKCCRPVPGDEIAGYVSLGKGITVHREDCQNLGSLRKAPERFVPVAWEGGNESAYRVELQVDAWDRVRLLEDLTRTFAEAGVNILRANCTTSHPMVKNRFVIEVGDTDQLKQCISRLRHVESVFDAYRVTPGS
jgi:GTP pyrophosphokinase